MRQPISSRRLLLFPMFLLAGLLAAQEPELKPAPAAKSAETPLAKVVVPGGTHLPLVLQNTISTKTAEPGDPLYFETTYPVVVNNRILIPVGSFVRGTLTEVKRPGRIRGRGELHVRFDELTLPNGYTVNLTASLATTGAREGEEVDREEGSVKSDSTKGQDIGTVATTGGAGAGIGAGVGAAAGLAAVLLTRGRELELPRGTTVDIVFERPLELDPALAQFDWTGQSTALPAPAPRDQSSSFPRIPR